MVYTALYLHSTLPAPSFYRPHTLQSERYPVPTHINKPGEPGAGIFEKKHHHLLGIPHGCGDLDSVTSSKKWFKNLF
jgi:hypothetical protein